jgi:hypothetical protein
MFSSSKKSIIESKLQDAEVDANRNLIDSLTGKYHWCFTVYPVFLIYELMYANTKYISHSAALQKKQLSSQISMLPTRISYVIPDVLLLFSCATVHSSHSESHASLVKLYVKILQRLLCY